MVYVYLVHYIQYVQYHGPDARSESVETIKCEVEVVHGGVLYTGTLTHI